MENDAVLSEVGILLKVKIESMTARPQPEGDAYLTMMVDPLDAELQQKYECPFELIVPEWLFFKLMGKKQTVLMLLRRPCEERSIPLKNQNDLVVFDYRNWRVVS